MLEKAQGFWFLGKQRTPKRTLDMLGYPIGHQGMLRVNAFGK